MTQTGIATTFPLMIPAFTLAIGQLGDSAIIRVIFKVLTLTVMLFALFGLGAWQGGAWIASQYGLSDSGLAAAGAAIVSLFALWLFFRIVAVTLTGLFADQVVHAVEARHYPDALERVITPAWPLSARMAIASALRTLLFNLAALPVYGLLLITGVGTIAVFAIVNALLLGRDLGEMVAIRHMPPEAMRGWLATTRWQRFLLGLAVTGLFVIPVANLLAPVIGAAMATHIFHRGRR